MTSFTRRRMLLGSSAAALFARRSPSILLISGWNLYNIGDVAITPGFLRLVQQHFPEARVTVLAASYPKELEEYLQPRFPEMRLIPMEFKAGQPLSPAMEEAFRGADLLALNSGMTLSYGYYGLEWDRYIPRLIAFMKAREMKIPYGVYGHSFDKLEPQGDILYRDVLGSAAFVYTRDSESLKLLKSRGVRCPKMAFGGDSTFGFDLKNDAAADELLVRYGLTPGKFLAFIPRLDVNRFRADGKEHTHAEKTRALIERYVRDTGETVVLVPEVKTQIEPAKTMVYDALPEAIRRSVRFKPDFWMPDVAQSFFTRARCVVSSEMHSVILGLAAGTPSLHPYFPQAGLKQWMMKDIGLPEWLLDIDAVPVERIGDEMVKVFRDTGEARRRTAKAMEFVRGRQKETMAVVRQSALSHAGAKEAG